MDASNASAGPRRVTRIKICGITRLDDALCAVECGADALGFILVPDTPRYIGGRPDARRLLQQIPPFVSRVAVCRSAADLTEDLADCFDTIQFYDPEWDAPRPPSCRLIKACRIRSAASLQQLPATEETADALLLDAWHEGMLGGSGEAFSRDLAVEARRILHKPMILAGGLTPDNVAEAVRAVRPFAVDVSSGVEAEPGRKDPAKVKAFCEAVREAL